MAAELGLPAGRSPSRHRDGMLWYRPFGYWLAVYRRVWRASVFSGFLAPVLYLGSLGFGLGSLVDRGGERLDGVPYAAFVAPGVLAATAMQTAIGEATFPVLGAVKWQMQYRAQLAAPLGVLDVLFGHLAFVLLRVLIAACAFGIVGALLGTFRSWWVLLALPVCILVGAAHATPVMAFAVRCESDAPFNLIFRFGVVPMFLFAGTFFPIGRLPAALQVLARVTPVWHGTQLCRDLALGRPSLPAGLGHAGYLLAWTLAGVVLARRAYRGRLQD